MKVVFVGINILINEFADQVSENCALYYFKNYKEKNVFGDKVNIIPTKYNSLGINFFSKILNLEVAPPSYAQKLNKRLKEIKPEAIVVFDFYRLYFIQSLLYVLFHPKCKLYIYSETQRWPKNPVSIFFMGVNVLLIKLFNSKIERIITYTDLAKKFLTKLFPYIPIVVCPVAIDTKLFKPENINYKNNDKVGLIMNARFVPYKKHTDLIDAINLLPADYKNKLHITFVGRSGNENDIKSYINKINLQNEIQWVSSSSRESMPELYSKHDILVLPSKNEALGLVVPEAMSCGLATVTSDSVGANVYVKEGLTGLVFKTGDPKSLSNSIKILLDDREKLINMKKAARLHILEKHSMDEKSMFKCLFS